PSPRPARGRHREPGRGHPPRPGGAPGRVPPGAPAVHGAAGDRRPGGAAALAQREVRPQPAATGVVHVTGDKRPTIAAFGEVDGQLRVGGLSLERLTERVGSTPYFAYDRGLLTSRISLL